MGRFGAGIVPFARRHGKVYIVLGRESNDIPFPDSGKWSDFGGGSHAAETEEECAAREGFEETMGLFGSKQELMEKITNCQATIRHFKYVSFIIEVDYDESLPKQFSTIYQYTKDHNPQLIQQSNGLFEKDMIAWFPLEDFRRQTSPMSELRPFYKGIIEKLCIKLGSPHLPK